MLLRTHSSPHHARFGPAGSAPWTTALPDVHRGYNDRHAKRAESCGRHPRGDRPVCAADVPAGRRHPAGALRATPRSPSPCRRRSWWPPPSPAWRRRTTTTTVPTVDPRCRRPPRRPPRPPVPPTSPSRRSGDVLTPPADPRLGPRPEDRLLRFRPGLRAHRAVPVRGRLRRRRSAAPAGRARGGVRPPSPRPTPPGSWRSRSRRPGIDLVGHGQPPLARPGVGRRHRHARPARRRRAGARGHLLAPAPSGTLRSSSTSRACEWPSSTTPLRWSASLPGDQRRTSRSNSAGSRDRDPRRHRWPAVGARTWWWP